VDVRRDTCARVIDGGRPLVWGCGDREGLFPGGGWPTDSPSLKGAGKCAVGARHASPSRVGAMQRVAIPSSMGHQINGDKVDGLPQLPYLPDGTKVRIVVIP
jgi:hypothetical protein